MQTLRVRGMFVVEIGVRRVYTRPHELLTDERFAMPDEIRQCPFCDEGIRPNAMKCKHCGTMLDGSVPFPRGTPPPPGATPFPAGATPAPGAAPAWSQVAGPLSPGTVVREYCIERMLGKGGMGEVYLADQTTTGRQVAMKVVAPELMRDEGVRRRFMEEARVMAALDHPSIVSLYTFFEEGGRFFLVMKYVDGESLEDRIERDGPMPVEEAVRVSTAVLAALEYAHTQPQPVIHRDIKPANIQLGKDGSAVVMDFGIAKAIGRENLTRTAGIVGTYEYMSPEQIMGGEVGPATDIYCFGITLYKMLTGVVPFPQKTDTGIDCMDGHRHKPVLPLAEFRDGLPDWLQGVAEGALAKQPGGRFSSASAMSAALRPTSSPPGPSLGSPSPKPVVAPAPVPPPAEPVPPTSSRSIVEHDPRPTGPSAAQAVLAIGLAVIFVAVFVTVGMGWKISDVAKMADKKVEQKLKERKGWPGGEDERRKEEAAAKRRQEEAAAKRRQEEAAMKEAELRRRTEGMVLIPEGTFMMGCNEEVDSECEEDEKPYHEVYLDAYYLDRHEVTVAGYGKCVEAGKCDTPRSSQSCNWGISGRDDHPVNCVSWDEATAYCKYAGKRLPTEAEWEKAARGTDGRKYPWGNEIPSCALAVMHDGGDGCGKDRTWPVCSKEPGHSPYGLCDMSGNVYECVADWYGEYPYEASAVRNPGGPSSGKMRVLRGGSWYDLSGFLRASDRVSSNPDFRSGSLAGFRCAVSPE